MAGAGVTLPGLTLPASVSVDGITADLMTGTISVDVSALLASQGLDLNKLPPNTSLVPYLVTALTTVLPAALKNAFDTALGSLKSALGGYVSSVVAAVDPAGGAAATLLTNALDAVVTPIETALESPFAAAVAQLGTAFTPLGALLGKALEIVVNAQTSDGRTFTETAVQIEVAGAALQLNLARASVTRDQIGSVTPVELTSPALPTSSPPLAYTGVSVGSLTLLGLLVLCLGVALMASTLRVPARAAV